MDKRSNAANHHLCHFSYADGHRCRMLRHRDHPGLCPFHSREERQRIESERIGTELAASLTGHFLTAADINHVLGKVFTALAQDRISVRKAATLCYAAQLMLQSLPDVKHETKFKYTYESWSKMIDNAVHLPDPIGDTYVSSSVERSSPHVGAGFSPSPPVNGPRATSEPAARRGDFASPSDPRAAVGAGFTPSAAAGAQPLGVGPSACPPWRPSPEGGSEPLGVGPLGPTYKTAQTAHLSSPQPLAPSASACGDSSHLAPNDDSTNEHTDEDNTEEPALVSAGPFHRHRLS